MEPDLVTEQRLEAVLGGLARREPIFHRHELVNDRKSFERETAGDFWEVAASGQRLSREFVWAELKRRYENSERDQYETGGSQRLSQQELGDLFGGLVEA